jgi:hypothetical protein
MKATGKAIDIPVFHLYVLAEGRRLIGPKRERDRGETAGSSRSNRKSELSTSVTHGLAWPWSVYFAGISGFATSRP